MIEIAPYCDKGRLVALWEVRGPNWGHGIGSTASPNPSCDQEQVLSSPRASVSQFVMRFDNGNYLLN